MLTGTQEKSKNTIYIESLEMSRRDENWQSLQGAGVSAATGVRRYQITFIKKKIFDKNLIGMRYTCCFMTSALSVR